MGEFKSGIWLVILMIYFFSFFLVCYSVQGSLNHYDIENNITFDDSGMLLNEDPLVIESYCTSSFLDSFNLIIDCHDLEGISEDVCDNEVEGCEWGRFDYSYEHCHGFVNYSYYNATSPNIFGHEIKQSMCKTEMAQNDPFFCQLFKCEWVSIDITDTVENPSSGLLSSVMKSVSFMTGFSADLDLPIFGRFIYFFVLFFLPLWCLLWAGYMALPVIH